MIDEREIVRRAAETLTPPEPSFDRLVHRRDRVQRNRRVRAGVLGIAIAIAVGWWAVDAIRNAPIPADSDRSEEFGIFAPVVGRITYVNDGTDLGYGPGLWAVDPSGPSDTTPGPSVADDIVSDLVRLGPEDGIPLGWSSDGTELLFKRTSDDVFPEEYLSILHSDGSETQLNKDPMYFGGATISPDGTRVVFAAWADDLGLCVVDAEGGPPDRLPLLGANAIVAEPTFSPDGTQIAYLDLGDTETHVWVMDADGGNAHEILPDEATSLLGVSGLGWSPTGDRLVLGVGDHEGGGRPSIVTFAPDGSDLTTVITGGIDPYWSPDGTRIAFTIPCDEQPDARCPTGSNRRDEYDPQPGEDPAGLAIADADGSNARAFGFAASGPWHPGAPVADALLDDPAVPASCEPPVVEPLGAEPSIDEDIHGWPDNGAEPEGWYSWKAQHPNWMHRVSRGASGLEFVFVSEAPSSRWTSLLERFAPTSSVCDAVPIRVAGFDGTYREVGPGREEWVLEIDGTTVRILFWAHPGTTDAELAEAHAVLGSISALPQDGEPGFVLAFKLPRGWDSG